MASLFGALGSLAESYGLARQQMQENALANLRQQLEQRYVDMAGQRLSLEREEDQQRRQQFQQEFGERQKEFEWRQRQADLQQKRDENTLQDMGMPVYTDPNTGEQIKPFYRPFSGDWVNRRIPGTGVTGQDTQQYINDVSQNDPDLRRYLTTEAHRLSLENQGDQRQVLKGVGTLADAWLKEKRTAASKSKKTPQSKTEALAGLRALKTSVAQLEQTLGVLDSDWGGYQMAATGVGGAPEKTGGTSLGAVAGRLLTRFAYKGMSTEQNAYIEQLNQATSQIPVLRDYFGKGTRAMAYINALVRDLPDPTTTPNSYEGRRKLNLVKQEIGIIEQTLAQSADETTGTSGIPGATPNLLTPENLGSIFGR